eukprot:18928_1
MSTEKQTSQNLDIDNDENIEVIEIKKKKPNMSFTTKTLPRSKLFGKTESFLKQMQQSNEDLQQKIDKMGTNSVLIENFNPEKNENNSPYIDMDLYVGIMEQKNKKSEQLKVQSTTDKLLGINQKQKKSVIIEETDIDNTNDNEDIDL